MFGNNLTLTRAAGAISSKSRSPIARNARRGRATAIVPRHRLAATDRPAPRATSAATTTSGSTTAREYVTVNGEKRTSIIVDPPNGRVPQLTAAARQRAAARPNTPTSDEQEGTDPGLERAPGAYDDPERRPLGERCLLGFGSTSGPPALPVLYNNLHQIVQTRDSIMILNEMDHDARIIRMNSQHLPATVRKWMGDSIGRWEGDTLVVDTTNFTDKTRFRGSTDKLHVVERFTRVDGKTLLYRFTVEDPDTWAPAMDGRIHLAGDRHAALRVRVPRRELCPGQHSPGRPPAGRGRSRQAGREQVK